MTDQHVQLPEGVVAAIAEARHERLRPVCNEEEQWSRPWADLNEVSRTGVINALRNEPDLQNLTDAFPAIEAKVREEERERLRDRLEAELADASLRLRTASTFTLRTLAKGEAVAFQSALDALSTSQPEEGERKNGAAAGPEDAYCVEEFLRKVQSWEGSDEGELTEAIEAAEKLSAALDPDCSTSQVGEAGEISDGELVAAMQHAEQLEGEGKLEPVALQGPPENLLRVIYREPDGKQRRCSSFIPIPDEASEPIRAALAAASPRFTAYTYDEAERMARRQLLQVLGSEEARRVVANAAHQVWVAEPVNAPDPTDLEGAGQILATLSQLFSEGSAPNPDDVCTCGHTAHWHGQEIGDPQGTGECEHDADCECKVFCPAPRLGRHIERASAEVRSWSAYPVSEGSEADCERCGGSGEILVTEPTGEVPEPTYRRACPICSAPSQPDQQLESRSDAHPPTGTEPARGELRTDRAAGCVATESSEDPAEHPPAHPGQANEPAASPSRTQNAPLDARADCERCAEAQRWLDEDVKNTAEIERLEARRNELEDALLPFIEAKPLRGAADGHYRLHVSGDVLRAAKAAYDPDCSEQGEGERLRALVEDFRSEASALVTANEGETPESLVWWAAADRLEAFVATRSGPWLTE